MKTNRKKSLKIPRGVTSGAVSFTGRNLQAFSFLRFFHFFRVIHRIWHDSFTFIFIEGLKKPEVHKTIKEEIWQKEP